MRTKEEILRVIEDWPFGLPTNNITQKLTLEVLLDIRDMLQEEINGKKINVALDTRTYADIIKDAQEQFVEAMKELDGKP